LNTAALKNVLLNNADPIPALAGLTMTGGRLNVGRAVAACGPAGNTSPMVTLTNPADASTYGAPASIPISATASDANGAVNQVAFYAGTALLGVDNASPYQLTWTDAAVGNYSITAVATDNNGATTTSSAAPIHVLP